MTVDRNICTADVSQLLHAPICPCNQGGCCGDHLPSPFYTARDLVNEPKKDNVTFNNSVRSYFMTCNENRTSTDTFTQVVSQQGPVPFR